MSMYMYVPRCVVGDQRKNLWSQVPPFYLSWVLRLELRSLGLHVSIYLLSHITDSCFGGLRQCLTR